MKRRVAFLDVFAERPLAGNGLAVVDDADGVSDEVMLGFAIETRLSETTFVQGAGAEGADYRNRIWTPGGELPFAGHPSLGTAVAVARWRGVAEASLVQETGAGLQPVEVRRLERGERGAAAELWWASMLQAPTEWGPELDPAAAMAAHGLEPGDAHPEWAPQVVSTGVPHAIVPLASGEALARVAPDYPAIDELLAPSGAITAYLCRLDPGGEAVRARAFSRIVELGEDPATGSAAGPLCAYAHARGGPSRLTISQGAEMGRPSTLEAGIEGELVRVSGSVAPLIEGSVELPGE
ncbi:MAG: PhzF family phenazine biosynthesis protein [Actinobacteria bacterium]|nr:PhzF family phenazine biosynthesis protein [Actinomycetota bacterium]